MYDNNDLSGQSKATPSLHMDSLVIFTKLHQRAPRLVHPVGICAIPLLPLLSHFEYVSRRTCPGLAHFRPQNCLFRPHRRYGVHIGATWRIRRNRPCVAAMRLYVKLLWPLVTLTTCYMWDLNHHLDRVHVGATWWIPLNHLRAVAVQPYIRFFDHLQPIVTNRVAWSIGQSVCHTSEPCKNGWTDRFAVWVVDSDGRKEARV